MAQRWSMEDKRTAHIWRLSMGKARVQSPWQHANCTRRLTSKMRMKMRTTTAPASPGTGWGKTRSFAARCIRSGYQRRQSVCVQERVGFVIAMAAASYSRYCESLFLMAWRRLHLKDTYWSSLWPDTRPAGKASLSRPFARSDKFFHWIQWAENRGVEDLHNASPVCYAQNKVFDLPEGPTAWQEAHLVCTYSLTLWVQCGHSDPNVQ